MRETVKTQRSKKSRVGPYIFCLHLSSGLVKSPGFAGNSGNSQKEENRWEVSKDYKQIYITGTKNWYESLFIRMKHKEIHLQDLISRFHVLRELDYLYKISWHKYLKS